VGIALLSVWRLMTELTGPVESLRATVARLRQGDLSARAAPMSVEELDTIASGVNALATDLQDQRSSRLAFFGAVAHDLRNPMNAMRLALARVRPGRPLPKEEDLRQMVQVMARQLDLQERLVCDLLDQARLEAGEITLVRTPISLVGLCEGVVELLTPTAPGHQLVVVGGPLGVLGDGPRLEQMLVNLIGNAIKYSPGGGRVEIRVTRRDDRAEIVIADEGMGIAPADLPDLFQPFRRSPRVSDIPGSGLGLSAVRRIVEAHGGTITVESTLGRGASFRVVLPSVVELQAEAQLTH
jgi:signal transduction histidine kinase